MSKNTPKAASQPLKSKKPAGRTPSHLTAEPLILAVETSGRTGSVALAVGGQMLAEAAFSAPMRHSLEIFPTVVALLARLKREPGHIEHIYISVGPGSFTGLRIAVTMAKMMHFANASKIVAVDTLDVIAANAPDYINTGEKIVTILDAKRGQFFTAVYQKNQSQWTKLLPGCLMTAPQFLNRFARREPIWLLGEGLVYYKDRFKADGIRFLDKRYWSPRAEKVHLLGWEMALAGQFANALTLQPAYLRRPEAEEKRSPHKPTR